MSDNKVKMKNVARKSDVWHLVTAGVLIQHHFDFEAFGLKTNFAQIMSYGDATGDIAGNLIDSTELEVKRPDRYLPSPQALLVTKTPPEKLDEEGRLEHREAMGQIAQRFELAAMRITDLDLEEEEIDYHVVRKKGKDDYGKDKTEVILKYPLIGDDGEVCHDVRIHPESNKIAFRIDEDVDSPYYQNRENQYYVDKSDGSKWMLIEPRIQPNGFRIKWYDVNVLRTNLLRAGYHPSNTFFTQSKAVITDRELPKNIPVDTFTTALATHVLGPQGEEGLDLGERLDARTSENVPSARLDLIMKANSRFKNDRRNVREGVFMPDGSRYDSAKAHKHPQYDSLASFALSNYCRELAPDVVKHVEQQANDNHLKQFLSDLNVNSRRLPIYVVPRSSYPHAPVADPVAFITNDDQQGNLRRTMTLRLDVDLEAFKYEGMTLPEMVAAHKRLPMDKLYESPLYRMVKEQNRQPDALLRIHSTRKWQVAMKLEDAVNTPAVANWDFEDLAENRRFLFENDELVDALKECVEIMNWEIRQKPTPPNPMMEEQGRVNGFGDLDRLERDAYKSRAAARRSTKSMAGHAGLPTVVEMLHEKAMDVFTQLNNNDELLYRLVLQPHPLEWGEDLSGEELEKATESFKALFKKVYKRLRDIHSPHTELYKGYVKHTPRKTTITAPETPQQARTFRHKAMQKILQDHDAACVDETLNYADGMISFHDFMYSGNGKRTLIGSVSRDFRIVDLQGRVLTLDAIKRDYADQPKLVHDKLESGEWSFEFYRLESEPGICAVLMQYADSAYTSLEDLPQEWQEQYAALRQVYLYGAPHEQMLSNEDQRWDTVQSLRRELERLEMNARQVNTDLGGPFGAVQEGTSRAFNNLMAGEAELFMQSDEGQRILSSYRELLDRTEAEFPYETVYADVMNYDPVSGLPYDRIEHEIPREKGGYVEITVPDGHLRDPLFDMRFKPMSVVVPQISARKQKLIESGVPVVFRGKQTGRVYYPGPIDLEKRLPSSTNASFKDYFAQAQAGYESDSGDRFPPPSKRQIVTFQELIPVANSRDVDPSHQSVRVPAAYFDALVSPHVAHRQHDIPMTGMVIMGDQLHQTLDVGEPIRFRECEGSMHVKLTGDEGVETGHTYESEKLKSVETLTFGELKKKVKHWSDNTAQKYGYAGKQDLIDKINQVFIDRNTHDADSEELVMVQFAQVSKDSWAYFNPAEAPRAAFTVDGQPTPPSAYRWCERGESAKNDTANDNAPDASYIHPSAKQDRYNIS